MKRLIRISLDVLVTSIVPILGWFLLGIILGGDLINIFSLTYPIQFIMGTLSCIFSTGANISKYKDKNKNAVNSGIVLGIILGGIIFGFIAFNIKKYIQFMNMDPERYKVFGIYSVIQIYFQFILNMVLTKLYYKEKNIKANRIAITFNVINFVTIVGAALITRNEYISSIFSLAVLAVYIIYILSRNLEKFKLKLNIINCIKYDSVELFSCISLFIVYLFGLSNSFEFGEKYILAISFETLVSDIQWDVAKAIDTIAKIDISKKKFNYKKHKKNAYKLIFILIFSMLIMTAVLYKPYNVDLSIAGIFILGDVISFLIYPLYIIKTYYLQLEYSALKTTINKQVASFIRMIMSFLPTPYCTLIGHLSSVLYQNIYTAVMSRNVDINATSKRKTRVKATNVN